MNSPFENGHFAGTFDKMLIDRFDFWAKQRRNLLARRRYAAKCQEKRKSSIEPTY